MKPRKDLIDIFSDVGKGLKKVFKPNKSIDTTHSFFSFGAVYVNNLAKDEIAKINPIFPEGSIIVREKRLKIDDEKPQTVIAMVKHAKGFSEKTNDWEFLTFNGTFLTLKKRETKGDCAKCHAQVENTDFVFKTYLK